VPPRCSALRWKPGQNGNPKGLHFSSQGVTNSRGPPEPCPELTKEQIKNGWDLASIRAYRAKHESEWVGGFVVTEFPASMRRKPPTPVENAADHYNPHWRWQLPSSPLLKADRHDPHWRWRR
jgi:hypothetical protein